MANPIYPARNNSEAIELNISNANQFFTVLQGGIDDTIPTYEGNGEIPSVAKALNEAAAYKVPLTWETTGESTDLMQPYEYDGNVYVPISIPAPFSTAPSIDYWRLYSQKQPKVYADTLFFDGNGVTVDFSIPSATISDPSAYFVTIDGIVQRPTIDYTVNIATDTLTFTEAPPAPSSGSNNIAVTLIGEFIGGLSERIYDTSTEGLSKTPQGQYYQVKGTDPEIMVDLYKNDAGTAVKIDSYPNKFALDNAIGILSSLTDDAVVDSAVAAANSSYASSLTSSEAAQDALASADRAESEADRAESEANRAELGAEAALTSGWIYQTAVDGEAARTDGDYFWVVSAYDSEALELWLMGSTAATDTGKRTATKNYIDEVEAKNIELSNYQGVVGNVVVGAGAFSSSGSAVSDADYKRTASTIGSLFRCDPESADYYYSGEIADAGYVGVIYKDESGNNLGFECDSAQVYSRYKLTPPNGTYWIATCSLKDVPLLIEKQHKVNAAKKSLSIVKRLDSALVGPFENIAITTGSNAAITREWTGPNTAAASTPGYQRMPYSSVADWVLIEENYRYFYTGEIDDAAYVGIAYLDSNSKCIGNDCFDLTAYNRYELSPPDGAMYIAGCSLMSNPLILERCPVNYTGIAEEFAKVSSIERSIDVLTRSLVSKEIGSITTTIGALSKSTGAPVGAAAEYLRTSVANTYSPFNVIDETAGHYYTGEIDNTNYAGVIYLDANLSMLGFECDSAQVYDNYPLALPEGTAYIATCSKGVAPIISYDVVSTGGSRTIYVDANYSGGNSDGSITQPFTTISSAINDANGGPATFVIAGGDYRETLPLSSLRKGLHQFIGKQTETVRILGSDKLTGWSLNSGSVYQAEYSGTIPDFPRLGGRLLFEDGNPSKEITDSPHHLQRNLSYRLPFTPIYPRDSIAEVEDVPGTYYHDGSTIYLHPSDGGDPSTNGYSYEVIVRAANTHPQVETQENVVDLYMQNLQFMFNPGVRFEGFNYVKRVNCTSLASYSAGAWMNQTGYIETWFEEAGFCNGDGENSHFSAYSDFKTDTDNRTNYPNVVHNYLWSHDNGDDGESSHENHNVVMVGCLLEWNGDSGSRPSNDATYAYHSCYARKNGWEVSNYWQTTSFRGGEGFAVVNPVQNPNRVGCRAYLDNCVSEENCVGYGTLSQAENYIEVVNSISRNNTVAEFYASHGKIVSRNNRATNADPLKLKVTANDGVIEVLNDDILV